MSIPTSIIEQNNAICSALAYYTAGLQELQLRTLEHACHNLSTELGNSLPISTLPTICSLYNNLAQAANIHPDTAITALDTASFTICIPGAGQLALTIAGLICNAISSAEYTYFSASQEPHLSPTPQPVATLHYRLHTLQH